MPVAHSFGSRRLRLHAPAFRPISRCVETHPTKYLHVERTTMKNLVLKNSVVVVSMLASQIVAAQDESKEVTVKISPATIPQAALENPLLPPRLETTRGNAALLYLRAATMTANLKTELSEFREKLKLYLDSPIEDFPVGDARKDVAVFENALGELRHAARRRQCEWQLPLAESGTQLFYIQLPEMQALRDLARVHSVRARIEIHEGRIDDAIDSLQTGFAMGRHIADAPFLINALVGVAVAEVTADRVLELAQAENSPNLYWSLTALPRPFIDMRQSLEFEAVSSLMVFPELVNADTVTGEASRVEFENFLNRFDELATDSTNTTGPEYELRKRLVDSLKDDAAMKDVRSFLKDEGGYSDKAVQAMVPTQAVMIRERILYTRLRDAMFIHSFLPFEQAQPGFEAWGVNYRELQKAGKGLPLVALLLPGIDQACGVRARLQRRIASLRIVEAIRAYASANNGNLPESLSDLSLPVPDNPADGKPFAYVRKDNEATLQTDDSTRFQIHYRLQVRK